MTGPSDPAFDTLVLHAGAAPDPALDARAPASGSAASFVSGTGTRAPFTGPSGHAANAAFEERVAALEGGAGAVATASRPAALHLAIATLAGAGAHVVASAALAAASHHLLAHTLARFGIETTFVAPDDIDGWRAALRQSTSLLLGEAVGGAGLRVLDIPRLAEIAHAHGVPLLVDATSATPWLQRPLALGADLVIHGVAGLLAGPGAPVGGVLVDAGRFDWDRSGRFPQLSTPSEGFAGRVFTEESTVAAFLLRARDEGLRDFGAGLDPHAAARALQGLETLALRVERHVANTRKVVAFLAGHPQVARVDYPELAAHPDQALAHALLPRGAGCVCGIELNGGRAQVEAFAAALRIFSVPAAGDDGAAPAGIRGSSALRLSIGLEDADDLVADLRSALKAAEKAMERAR